jgi:hypothetical protein
VDGNVKGACAFASECGKFCGPRKECVQGRNVFGKGQRKECVWKGTKEGMCSERDKGREVFPF